MRDEQAQTSAKGGINGKRANINRSNVAKRQNASWFVSQNADEVLEKENTIALIVPIYSKNRLLNLERDFISRLRDNGFEIDQSFSLKTRFNDEIIRAFNETEKGGKKGGFFRKNYVDSDEAVNYFYKNVHKLQSNEAKDKQEFALCVDNEDHPTSLSPHSNMKIHIKLVNLRVACFSEGIGFISVFFHCYSDDGLQFPVENIFDIYYAINRKHSIRNAVKKLIDYELKKVLDNQWIYLETNNCDANSKSLTSDEENSYETDNYGSNSFACFSLKGDPSILNTNIPFWFTGKALLRNSPVVMEPRKMQDNVVFDSSIEGCCTLIYVDVNSNKKHSRSFFNKNTRYICQHSYFSYILALYQRYFFDSLKKKISTIEKKHSSYVQLYEVEDVLNEYVDFNTNLPLDSISILQRYQFMYDCYRSDLKIDALNNSIGHAIDALHYIPEKNVSRVKETFLAMISIIALLNFALNICGQFIYKSSGAKIIVVFMSIGIVLAVSILIVLFVMPGTPVNKRIYSCKKKNFVKKTVDKKNK